MKTITLTLQNKMIVTIENNNIIISIPDECKRDLWEGQLEFWLENDNSIKMLDSGKIRIVKNKIKISK